MSYTKRDPQTTYTYTTSDGRTISIDISTSTKYNENNSHASPYVDAYIQYYLEHSKFPNISELSSYVGEKITTTTMSRTENIIDGLDGTNKNWGVLRASVNNTGYTRDNNPEDDSDRVIYYKGADGREYTLDFNKTADGNTDLYLSDNALRRGTVEALDAYIQYFLQYGERPTKAALEDYMRGYDNGLGDREFELAADDFDRFLTANDISLFDYKDVVDAKKEDSDTGGITDSENPATSTTLEIDDEDLDPRAVAEDSYYNKYYKDLFSLSPGTTGATMLNRYALAEQNAALSNMQLAEAQYQQAAMQQAETVKAITDSVRAERMARLRAGMSESQIANQDMQVMLNNMNQLNQQVGVMNQNQLAAQQQYNLAQDTAYQQYIQSATGLGSVSAAMSASDAGDAYQQALRYMQQTGTKNFQKAYEYVTKGGTS